MNLMPRIGELASIIGVAAKAQRVYVFGSHARGDAGPDSDVDLLVVAESTEPRYRRSVALYRSVFPAPFPLDILVYTPAEIEYAKGASASFITHVLTEAVEVYHAGQS